MDEPSEDTRSLLGDAAPGPRVDRDLMFARVEQRLLGRALTPVRVGRFVVLERIGHGGMGVVYAAHDPELDRKLAVKIVDDGLPGDGTPQAHHELLREARAAATLTHPNVVTIYEVGIEGDAVFLAMEFVDGPTLRGWLSTPSRGWREVVAMFVAAARGLGAAHAAGLVHRDFKPDNVLIGEDGRPRVADFGLARPALRERTSPGDPSELGDDSYTSVAGTPRYMAPEQHEGRGIGAHSDQFAFCVALYEALFDRHPFEGSSRAAMVYRVMFGAPEPPGAAAGVPAGVSRLVMKGLERQSERRHESMYGLIDGLQRELGRRRRRVLAAGAVVLAGAAALGGYTIAPSQTPVADPCADATGPLTAHWAPSTSQSIEAAFIATEQAGASRTAGLVVGKLEDYVDRWSEIREQSCRATLVEGQRSDLLMELSYACLDRRLAAVSTLVERFEHADTDMLPRAAAAVDRLPPLGICEDRSRLLGMRTNALQARTDRTAQPEAYDRAAQLHDELRQAEVLRSLGRFEQAQGIAARVFAEGRAEHLRGVEAAAQGLRGRLRLRNGRSELDPAELDLRQAAALALEAGLDDVALEALLGTSRLYRKRREGLEQALVLLDVAQGIARRGPGLDAYELRIASERARVVRRLGRPEAARALLQEALAMAQGLGPDHESVLSARNDLAANMVSLGQLEEAEALFIELLPRIIAARGPLHRTVGTLRLNLGAVAHNQGHTDVAEAHYREALEFYERRGDDSGSESVRFRLGVLHREQGRLGEARAGLLGVLADREQRLGAEHADLAQVLDALAEVERQEGQRQSALVHARRAVELLDRAHGPEHLDVRAPLVTIGKTLIDDGQSAEAAVVLRRAHGLVLGTEVDVIVRAEVCFDLARATIDDPVGPQGALELAREASRLFGEAGERAADLRIEVDAWLGERGG